MAIQRKKTKRTATTKSQDLGSFLAHARQSKGFTLNEVAEAIGLRSGQSIWDWENGKGSGIPADMLLRLVKLYEISPEKAYDLLIDFHEQRVRKKVSAKFETARSKILGSRR